ncbi:MAG: metal ABC transporter ATP-binding protein [Chloroflexi bacterium]|nr:metal ABC transporter ATP-binding protein [Chloroflexota bacterium]
MEPTVTADHSLEHGHGPHGPAGHADPSHQHDDASADEGGHVPARARIAPGRAPGPLALEVTGLWAGYPGRPPAIEDVSFVVPEGEMVGLVGPNGAGKSTLFKSILGMLRPLRGDVRVFGRRVSETRRDIAYTPQAEEVDWDFPVSVMDVVLMGRWNGLRLFRRWSRRDRELAHEALDRVQMADLSGRQVGELSGGQRRRVLIARSIAREARLLLLDEPFAGLDASVEHDLLRILDDLTHDGCSILLATHDLSCVATACDGACCLNRRVQGYGAPSDVLTEEVLSRTFDRHLIAVGDGAVVFEGSNTAHRHGMDHGAN